MSARVLVIDDSPVSTELLVKGLGAAGISAHEAHDLSSLDERLSKNQYELVLVDVNMPEMYGDDVVEFLRVQRKLSAKLLLYSDVDESELQRKTKASGADGYIWKSSGLEVAVATVQQQLGAAAAPKKRVLVVDDSEATARLLEAELTARGFEVRTASSAEAATKIVVNKKTRPELVLLDLNMPNIDGRDFCRFIKRNSLYAGIKVILCSGADAAELQKVQAEVGADGFVTKDALIARSILEQLEE